MRDEGTRVVTTGESEKGVTDMKNNNFAAPAPWAKSRTWTPEIHTVGCVHDETGRGAVERSLKTSVISSCPVNSGDMASLECRLTPTHGLWLGWSNAVTRAYTAGLTGLGTPWDVCMMRRGRGAVERSLKTSVIGLCPVNSGGRFGASCQTSSKRQTPRL
jgi:hypothetical protein